MAQAEEQLLTTGSGALTNIGNDFVAWYKIKSQNSPTFSNATQQHSTSLPTDWQELEMFLTGLSRSLAITDDATKVATLSSLVVGTAGCGNMAFQSNSICDKPIVDLNFLRDTRDQEVALFAYRLTRQAIAGHNAMHPGVIISDEMSPGKHVTSDVDLLVAHQQERCSYTIRKCWVQDG
jgi:choline dehydrogenase